MAYLYNILACDTQEVSIGFSDSNGSVIIGNIYKVDGTCWEVQSSAGEGLPGAAVNLQNVQSYSSCYNCLNNIIPSPPPPGPSGQSPIVYLYRIRPCDNQSSAAEVDAYRESTNLFPDYSIKINGVCWQVLYANGSTTLNNVPAGAVDIRNLQSYLDCATCNNPPSPPPPPPAPGTPGPGQTFYYRVLPCGAPPTATPIPVKRVSGFADLETNSVVKFSSTQCFVVVQFDSVPATPVSQYSLDLTNKLVFQNCTSCQTSGFNCTINGCIASTNGPGQYDTIEACQSLCKNWICDNGACKKVSAAGTGTFATEAECLQNCQAPPPPPASGYNCTLSGCVASTSGDGQYSTLSSCQASCKNWKCQNNGGCVKVAVAGTGDYRTQIDCASVCDSFVTFTGETIYECTLRNCQAQGDVLIGWSSTVVNPGIIYKVGNARTWKCYTIDTVVGTSSPTVTTGGIVLDGRPTHQECEHCLPPVLQGTGQTVDPSEEYPVCCFVGDTKVSMADGTYKNIEDVEIGEKVITSAGKPSSVVNKLTPIVGYRGLLSINDGKAFATPDHIFKSIDGTWITADIELSRKSFKAFDVILKDGGIIKQLSVGDSILTESGPVVVESFEIINSGIFDDTIVYDLSLDSDGDHTYFVDSYAAHNCDGDNGPVIIFCQQFPDHPTCNPCYNAPCTAGCPLNCVLCIDDPRCPDKPNPCDEVPEPVQGALLQTRFIYSGWTTYAVPEPEEFLYLIDECWRWKYCVCRSQPDPINLPQTYEYRVCLCGEQIAPGVPNPCPGAGTFVGYVCKNTNDPTSTTKLDKYAIYNNGSCGTYEQLIETNSTYCGFSPIPGCPDSGTLIRTYCVNTDKYGEYHDGKCGKYIEKIEINSKGCGYVDPPPPAPPPPPKIVKEPATPAVVYYPVREEDTLRTKDVTSFALWSGNSVYLQTPSTESLVSSGSVSYILSVYDKSPDTAPTCSAELQYKIIYADYDGKGAKDLGGQDHETLTKAMYTQYTHVLLPHGQQKFNFNGIDEDYVYIIDISRNRFKESLDPGNWQMTLASVNMSANSPVLDLMTASYSSQSVSLVDTIANTSKTKAPVYITSQIYDVVLGTIEEGVGSIFITSSQASASIARFQQPEYTSFTTTTSNTSYIIKPSLETVTSVVAAGAEAIPFVFTNASSSVKLERIYSDQRDKWGNIFYFSENDANRNYKGSFTGSFTGSYGGTFIPSVISGSAWGYYDTDSGKFKLGTFWAGDVKYVTGSITYSGFLKFMFQEGGKNGTVYDCPNCKDSYISGTMGQNIASGSTTGSAIGYLMADSWGIDSIIGTSTTETVTITTTQNETVETGTTVSESLLGPTISTTYTELPNGNIIYPVRTDIFGKVYPNHGIIVLSGRKLDQLGFNTNRLVDTNGYNTFRLFKSMKLVLDQNLTDFSGDKLGFYARGVEIKHAARYFITLHYSSLNHSNNPTYVTGSDADVIPGFLLQNKAYFTSIGLYNADKELLAIGKISKPIMSSRTDEMLFTVKVTQ